MATRSDQINHSMDKHSTECNRRFIPRLDGLSDVDCVEGMAIRFDALKRLLVSIGIEETTVQLVDTICQSLNECHKRYPMPRATSSSSQPARIHRGHCGQPLYEIRDEQLSFLLEQGFKVAEVSNMLGVSKRTGAANAFSWVKCIRYFIQVLIINLLSVL